MTKKQKIIIISIVVLLLLLYAATLVMFSSQDDSNPSASDPSATPDWTKVMSSLMSPFAEKVDLTNLNCNGQPVSSEFTLNGSSGCKIAFGSASLPGEEDFWKTEIEILSTGIKVYTKYSDESCGSNGSLRSLPSPALELMYLPSGESGISKDVCWLEQKDSAISFTVLDEDKKNGGSSLTITCNQCTTPIRAKLN